jgi:hypothetical protein
LPQRSRTVSPETPDEVSEPACPAIDHTYEYLKIMVTSLAFVAATARQVGSEETIENAAAALASARRDLALHVVQGWERDH